MASSGSSSIINSRLRVRPIESDDELVEASMDLLWAHVRLIMVKVLTMEESKLILLRAFSALGRINRDFWLLDTRRRIESLLEQRERARSFTPSVDAARQVAQKRLDGDWGQGWSAEQWREREAVLLDRMTRRRQDAITL